MRILFDKLNIFDKKAKEMGRSLAAWSTLSGNTFEQLTEAVLKTEGRGLLHGHLKV